MSDNVEVLGQGIRLSLSALSREFGFHRDTIKKRLAQAGVRPDGERNGNPVYRLRDAAPVVLDTYSTAGRVEDPDLLTPTDRKAWYQSEKDRVALEKEQGVLVPREEVREQLAIVIKIAAQMLETLPDILERDCRLPPDMVDMVERRIDQARADWAEALEQ